MESLRPPRVSESSNEHEYVSLEEILRLVAVPHKDDDLALLRDKAAAALLFLSGARASAVATLPISAVDLPGKTLRQWPELGVATKNGKRATTFLLPIPALLSIAQTWDDVVRSKLPSTAPWYAPISTALRELEPGYQIARLRIRRGLTQAQLAEMVGTRQPSIARLENGNSIPSLSFLRRIADALDARIELRLIPEDAK